MSLLASNPTKLSIVRRLAAAVDGRVITPGDAAYDRSRSVFHGGFDHHPAVVVRPTDASEVSQVVSLAAEHGLELAVRSGGHSLAGHSTTEGGSCWTWPTCGPWRSIPRAARPGPRPA